MIQQLVRLRFGAMGLLALLIFSCQNATQPTDLTTQRTMTLELRSTSNEPIIDATIDWSKFTGINAPIGARAVTGPDGYAQWVIPEVSTLRDSVRLIVNVPSTSPTGAAGPLTFTTSVCNDTLITLAVAPPTPCGSLNGRDTVLLETCPQGGLATARECVMYLSTCPDGLIYTATDSTQGSISVDLRSFNVGSSGVEVCATYAPPLGTAVGQSEEFTVRVEGRTANSNAVLVAYDVVIIGAVSCQPCPCPTFQRTAFTTQAVCIGATASVDVPLTTIVPAFGGGPDCVTDFTLASGSDNAVKLTSGQNFVVRSGQLFPEITLEITPQNTGQIKRTLEWTMQTRNLTTGVIEQCPSRLVLDLTTDVLSPACVVNQSLIDTLQKCVFADTSTTDTFSIANNGDCEITVNVRSNNGLFTIAPSGQIVLAPRSKRVITISFGASKPDWDANPATPIAGRGDKFFAGTISVTGCGPDVNIGVVGDAYIQCDAFKYQCLRQFRPAGFPNVYAESIQLVENKTNIVYQNDNQSFQQYDVFVKSLTPNGTTFDVELGSGGNGGQSYGVFRRIATGFSVNPGQSICDTYPLNAASECSDMKNDLTLGSASLAGLSAGDVVLYTKIGSTGLQCALIWIQAVGLDRPGPNSLPQVCIEICYPMFVL